MNRLSPHDLREPDWRGRTHLLDIVRADDHLRLILLQQQMPWGWRKRWHLLFFDAGQFASVPLLAQDILVSPTGSNQTHTSDETWNNADNKVECLGAGGSGGVSRSSNTNARGAGGGGGGYSAITNFPFASPGTTTAPYRIGAKGTAVVRSTTGATAGNAGGDTWFNDTSMPTPGTDNAKCAAKGGGGGDADTATSARNGGSGGDASSGYGQTRYSGGRGGNIPNSSGIRGTGGGGAAGPNGAGNQGVDSTSASTATNGGSGDAGSGGSAGAGSYKTSGALTGGNGGTATEFDGSHGCGGGGGSAAGSVSSASTGGSGGAYGAGGGGTAHFTGLTSATSGAGADGIIVLTWTPVDKVYIGAAGQSTVYLAASDSTDMYKGAKSLF